MGRHVLKTPVRTPQANAFGERLIGTRLDTVSEPYTVRNHFIRSRTAMTSMPGSKEQRAKTEVWRMETSAQPETKTKARWTESEVWWCHERMGCEAEKERSTSMMPGFTADAAVFDTAGPTYRRAGGVDAHVNEAVVTPQACVNIGPCRVCVTVRFPGRACVTFSCLGFDRSFCFP
jgi:hypothetical protein